MIPVHQIVGAFVFLVMMAYFWTTYRKAVYAFLGVVLISMSMIVAGSFGQSAMNTVALGIGVATFVVVSFVYINASVENWKRLSPEEKQRY